MKPKISFFLAFLLLAGAAYMGWTWHLSVHARQWLWADGYVAVAARPDYGGFRVRLHPVSDSLWQTTDGNAPLDSCFALLQKGDSCRLWLVADSLNASNLSALVRTVALSASDHGVSPHCFMVETDQWDMMAGLTRIGISTLYDWQAPEPDQLTEEQRDSVVTRIYRTARSGQVGTLTVSRAWYPYFHGQLAGLDVDILVISPCPSAFRTLLDPMTRVMRLDPQVKGVFLPSCP